MDWLELGRSLQNLPRHLDLNHISCCKDLAPVLKEAFLSEVEKLDEKQMNYLEGKKDEPVDKIKINLIADLDSRIDEINDCMSGAGVLLETSRDFLKQLLFTDEGKCRYRKDFILNIPKGHNLYRMRGSDRYQLYDRKGLYIVSEENSCWVGMARFNSSGVPFLYLAESLYTAWEEMRRPDFHRANFVRLETSRELKVLDLTVPDVPNSIQKLVRAYLALACGMKVLNDEEKHHWQYELANLISNVVYNAIAANKAELDGIRYHSSKRCEEHFNIDHSRISSAYAFIPKMVAADDYCPHLASKFKMTEASSYFFLKVHRHKFNSVKDPNTSEYQHTIFAELEKILKSQPVVSCSELLKK